MPAAKRISFVDHCDMDGRYGVQVMVHRRFAYFAHGFAKSITTIAVRDLARRLAQSAT